MKTRFIARSNGLYQNHSVFVIRKELKKNVYFHWIERKFYKKYFISYYLINFNNINKSIFKCASNYIGNKEKLN